MNLKIQSKNVSNAMNHVKSVQELCILNALNAIKQEVIIKTNRLKEYVNAKKVL